MPEFEEDKNSEDSPGGSSPSVTFRQGSSPNDLVEGDSNGSGSGSGSWQKCSVHSDNSCTEEFAETLPSTEIEELELGDEKLE